MIKIVPAFIVLFLWKSYFWSFTALLSRLCFSKVRIWAERSHCKFWWGQPTWDTLQGREQTPNQHHHKESQQGHLQHRVGSAATPPPQTQGLNAAEHHHAALMHPPPLQAMHSGPLMLESTSLSLIKATPPPRYVPDGFVLCSRDPVAF